MRVCAYVHLRRTRLDLGPTGVGKHINAVVPALANVSDISLEVLGAREDLEADGSLTSASPLHGLPLRTFRWKRRYLEASWCLLKWPKAERWTGDVDWIYCPAEAYVPTRRAKLAVVVHCVNWLEPELPWYDDPDIKAARRGWAARVRRFRDSTHLLLPVSEFLAGRLTALFGIERERMRVVGNGVEDAYFSAEPLDQALQRRVGDRPYLLVVGGLTRRKGADCILKVARELARRRSDLRILIAGDGEPQFNAPAAELPNIERLGYVGAESGLPAMLRASVALLFPSRYETFGIPAVEAMAAGTPALVAHFGALPEVAGDAGIIVDPACPAAIADVAGNLARDSSLRAKYIEAGKKRAERFHWDECVRRTADAMREFQNKS